MPRPAAPSAPRPAGRLRMLGLAIAAGLLIGGPAHAKDSPEAMNAFAAQFRTALADGTNPVGFARWLSGIWAEEVHITHTPPMANDGPISGAKLGAGEVAVFTRMREAIPDYRQEKLQVGVDGDVITFSEELVGTLPDGTVHRAPTSYRFTVEGGKITKVHGIFDLKQLAPFTKVIADAGLRTPDGHSH